MSRRATERRLSSRPMWLGSQWRWEARQAQKLEAWRSAGALDDRAWARAKELRGAWPAPPLWHRYLDSLGLWLGVALLGAAAICFIAANWDELGRAARLYGAQGALVISALAAWRLTPTRPGGQAALLLSGVLLGALLALLGQTYQTGADTWELFALWAALLVPWTLAGASTATLLLFACVANLAIGLFLDERFAGERVPFVSLGAFNLAIALGWQLAADRVEGLRGRIGPRLAATAALIALAIPALADVFGDLDDGVPYGFGAWLLGTAALIGAAWRWRRDVAVLALAALSVIVVDTTLLGRLLFELDHNLYTLVFLVLALAVVGQAAAVIAALRRLMREQ